MKETDPRKGYRGTPEPTARWGLRGAERDPRPLSRYREGAQEGTGGPQRPHSRYREGVWGDPGDPTADTERGRGVYRGTPEPTAEPNWGRRETPDPHPKSRAGLLTLCDDPPEEGLDVHGDDAEEESDYGKPRVTAWRGGGWGGGGSPLCPPLLPHIDTAGGVHALLARPQRGLKVMMM